MNWGKLYHLYFSASTINFQVCSEYTSQLFSILSFPLFPSLSFSLPPFLSLPFSPLSVCLCFCFLNKARNLVSKYNQGAIKNKERPKFLKTWGKEPCLFFFIPLQYFFTMLVNDRAVLYWLAFIFRTNSYAQKYWQ